MTTESMIALTIVTVLCVELALYMDAHRAEDRRQTKGKIVEK